MRLSLLLIGAVLAAALTASASGGPPLPVPVAFATAHGHPVAGKHFTGLTIVGIGAQIAEVTCDASVGSRLLVGHPQRFFSNRADVDVVTCGWNLPKNSARKLLHGTAEVDLASGGNFGSSPFAWRVKP